MMISLVILDLKMDQKAKVDLLRENIFRLELWVNFDHESNLWACVRA